MNGILALASLHIATTCGPSEVALMYYEAGLQYYNRSLTPFRNAIDSITPHNCDAVFAHSIVMIAIGIASPQLTGMKDECASTTKNIVILFELLQGVKKILQVSKSWIKLELFSQGEFWKNTPAELDPDTEAALTHLSDLNDQVMADVVHITKIFLDQRNLHHAGLRLDHAYEPQQDGLDIAEGTAQLEITKLCQL
ncbi:hypothetical protein E8E15_006186 [Penicillium rubens]|nr:hypothetical protein E8E15_006186 [Penicillium rubens]